MSNIFRFLGCATVGTLIGIANGQAPIPVAEPVGDGNAPLRATPQQDQLRIADMLFLQAQETKNNPAEYKRMMALTAQRYSEFVQANPQSPDVPVVLYRMASCLMDSGQTTEAYQTFGTIVQRYKGDPAAAAAYRLASEAYKTSDWNNAARFYLTTIQQTTQNELKTDASYRLGRVYLAQKKPDLAAEQFRSVVNNPKAQSAFRQASIMALAALQTDAGKNEEAYALYRQLLKEKDLDVKTRGSAMLQAAALATVLNKANEARDLYDQIIKNPELAGNTAEAQIGLLIGLFKQGKYQDVIKFYDQGQIASRDKNLEAKRRLVVGQAAYHLKDYERAITLFTLAEKSVPHTETAMEAAYRRLICQNELKIKDFPIKAQTFLNSYARAFPTSPWPDMVRLMAAENLFATNPAQAAAFYEAINLDKIDKSLKPDIIYRDAWACGKAGNRERAIALLDLFVKEYPKDRRVPTAVAFRGDMNMQTGREVDALRDFEQVIKTWPRNDAAALAWQKTAQIYNRKQDTLNMIKSYEGLLKNFPKAMPAALAEARFMIGRGYFERKEFDKAVPNLEEARTLNPEKYGEQVDMLMILGYYQLQDTARLKDALEALRKKDLDALNRVPEAITAWLGIRAFETKDYEIADRYLTLATKNNELKQARRIIWKNLAKSRIALKRYETALVAIDFYLKEEHQPYARVEGQLDKASILLGLGKYAEARKIAEEGLGVGVEGPLLASLKIVLGDIAYSEKKYDEAAKQYGTTAELFVSDRELLPEALYKAWRALTKAGRDSEAAPYKARLDKEFPNWKPSPHQELS